jgi:hypothetical protein
MFVFTQSLPPRRRGLVDEHQPSWHQPRLALAPSDENFPVWSGALATGGDLAFYGTA